MGRMVLVLVIALLVAACQEAPTPVTAPSTAPGASPAAGVPQPSFGQAGPFEPAALADAIEAAGTDADRERAIIAALAAIGIGVYTADGEPIAWGAERTSSDFMVYDFEISGLSSAIADGDDVYLEDIARELSVMNVASGGTAFSPADFATAVTAGAAEAEAHPERPQGNALRLARELGLRRATPFDLAAPPTAAPIVLDALSGFLVAADVSLPRILAAEPAAFVLDRVASVGDLSLVLTAADPCTAFSRHNGSWHAGTTSVPGMAGANASFSRSLQAQLLGATVKVGGAWDKQWHHRHEGQRAAPRLYTIGLQVRAPVPARVNCGPLRYGTGQVRGGGQIAGADVEWTHPDLDHHATVLCPSDGCLHTDAAGRASIQYEPVKEPGPGGLGPELKQRIPVTAEVNLFKALGPDLYGLLNLPPDMRLLARKEMPSDVSWHRGYKFSVAIDSQLRVDKAQVLGFKNHVGTASASGVIQITAVHPQGDAPYDPPEIDTLLTVTDPGTGPACAPGNVTAGGVSAPVLGSLKYKSDHRSISFQAVDAVVDPDNEISLYLDVGPDTAGRTSAVTQTLCDPKTGRRVVTNAQATNLWEATIFRGHPRGLAFTGLASSGAGAATNPGIWNLRATDADWRGQQSFVVATWDTPETCGGYCDRRQSWMRMQLWADPLPDP